MRALFQDKIGIASLCFIAVMLVFLWAEVYYILLIPPFLMLVWWMFTRLEWVFYALLFFTPVSLNIIELGIEGWGLFVPTEPILLCLTLLFFYQVTQGKMSLPKEPLLFWVFGYFTWLIITTITSEMPLVSAKYVLSRAWYVLPCFLWMIQMLAKGLSLRKLFLLYFIPLLGVIIFTVVRHSFHGFDKDSAHWVMEPIFRDHTIYGAALALVFPFVLLQQFSKRHSAFLRFFYAVGLVILTVGLVLSYTRAAWLSIVGAAMIGVVMWLRIPFKTVLALFLIFGGLTFYYFDDIQVALKGNKKESSDRMDEHIKSISNVSSDASNLERLNRWHCAMAMFEERPIVGWGPGTYQFLYAPFQRAEDKTIISTNRGDGGNAHSEYLGPLAEQGVMGGLLFSALVIITSSLAFQLFQNEQHYEERLMIMGVFLGLMTYFIHGALNNFLDADKVAVPFWMFLAFLVYKKHFKEQEGNQANH
jgi:putative inorganic carbon (HCO3(-)) transporter